MKIRNKFILIILFISILMITISCKKQKAEWKVSIEIENGVTVIKNPKEPIYSEDLFNLKKELSIGESEGIEEYMFSEIGSIAVDDEERVYVSDWEESHIKIFNKDGEYLKTVGRKGQGPGEFDRISEIQITHQKELVVLDGNTRRLSFFSLDGKFIKNLSVSKMKPLRLKIDSEGNIIVSSVILDPKTYQAMSELKIYDSNLNLLKTIASYGPNHVFNPFLPFSLWRLAKNDNIVYGYNKTYELQIFYSEGNIKKKIKKDYNPVEITEQEKVKRMKGVPTSIKIEVPKFHPAFRWFTLDDKGRIFVQTYERTKDGKGVYYDVFNSEGRYIAKVSLKIAPRIWKKNKLYTIEENEEGFQMVKRYKVNWNI